MIRLRVVINLTEFLFDCCKERGHSKSDDFLLVSRLQWFISDDIQVGTAIYRDTSSHITPPPTNRTFLCKNPKLFQVRNSLQIIILILSVCKIKQYLAVKRTSLHSSILLMRCSCHLLVGSIVFSLLTKYKI